MDTRPAALRPKSAWRRLLALGVAAGIGGAAFAAQVDRPFTVTINVGQPPTVNETGVQCDTSLGVARLDIRCAPTGRMHPLPVLFLQVFRGGMLVGDIHAGMSTGTITSWRVLRAGERDYLEVMVAW
jgi:hypothetical protein